MLFSSPLFLFIFLPASILVYYSLRPWAGNRAANAVLLVFSYLFYLCGAGPFTLILLGSTVADYLLGLLILRRRSADKVWVFVSLTLNIGLLVYFKYANFFVSEANAWLSATGRAPVAWTAVALPIGISFFTFQKISYIIDVYRRHTRPLANFIDFALYVAMFPQLVAGPIVRFKDIWDQLRLRTESWENVYAGSLRFCWGLAKKVLIADACGQVADVAFGLDIAMLDTKTAWLGALAYSFQIYFDFSAYSDMAIGLARVFGFHLLENFNRPYAARSITDFWRRWHISLSRWFRDYVYIPLGGNRQTRGRTYANLLTVFTLCGLWHGANWTFVCWGLYHGFFLIGERLTGFRRAAAGRWGWIGRPLAFLIVLFGWVLFRADSLPHAAAYARIMAMPLDLPLTAELYDVLHYRNLVFMAVAAVATLGASFLPRWDQVFQPCRSWRVALGLALIVAVLPYCAAFVMAGAANPFIYFRF
jgi:alginate O-acetyltransferase complex protein AlgI